MRHWSHGSVSSYIHILALINASLRRKRASQILESTSLNGREHFVTHKITLISYGSKPISSAVGQTLNPLLESKTMSLDTVLDEWFKGKIAPADAPEDGCRPEEAIALHDYYHQKSTAQEAALSITRPVQLTEKPYDNLYSLWGLLIDALMEFPKSGTMEVVKLLSAIQDLPSSDSTSDQQSSTFSWAGLPRFAHMWADEHKQDHWRDALSTKDLTKRTEQRKKHSKRAFIEAQLVVANVGEIPLDWGYDCIADALERHSAILDFEIPAVNMWTAIAGQQLHAGVLEGRESWALEKKRDFQMESKTMSLDRWKFWGNRLDEIRQKARDLECAAKGAIGNMSGLDSDV